MTRPIYEPTPSRTDAVLGYGNDQLFRRPGPSTHKAVLFIKVMTDRQVVVVGDGIFEFEISEDMDTMVLTEVEGYVTTVSSSGGLLVQLHNNTAAVDMLSTRLGIDVSDLNSKDAATQPVINTSNDDVAWGDHIRIDIDSAGTGAKGLGVMLTFQ